MKPSPIAFHVRVEAGIEAGRALSIAGNGLAKDLFDVDFSWIDGIETFLENLFGVERLQNRPFTAGGAESSADAQGRVEADALKVEPKLADGLRVGELIFFRGVTFVRADEVVMRVRR